MMEWHEAWSRNNDPCGTISDWCCHVCGRASSTEPNVILLCDGEGCDDAYHLQCLDPPLAEVPEGNWFCPTCERKEPRGNEPRAEAADAPPVEEGGGVPACRGWKRRKSTWPCLRTERTVRRNRTGVPRRQAYCGVAGNGATCVGFVASPTLW